MMWLKTAGAKARHFAMNFLNILLKFGKMLLGIVILVFLFFKYLLFNIKIFLRHTYYIFVLYFQLFDTLQIFIVYTVFF